MKSCRVVARVVLIACGCFCSCLSWTSCSGIVCIDYGYIHSSVMIVSEDHVMYVVYTPFVGSYWMGYSDYEHFWGATVTCLEESFVFAAPYFSV